MDEDIITEKDLEEGAEITEYSPHEEIASCYYALASLEDVDPAIMTNDDKQRVREIKRYSLRLIHKHISEMYNEAFPKKEEKE